MDSSKRERVDPPQEPGSAAKLPGYECSLGASATRPAALTVEPGLAQAAGPGSHVFTAFRATQAQNQRILPFKAFALRLRCERPHAERGRP